MSTGKECAIYEARAGQWYWLHEDGQNDWDWRECAQAAGPYKSEDEAWQALRREHANPGGYTLSPANLTTDEDRAMIAARLGRAV